MRTLKISIALQLSTLAQRNGAHHGLHDAVIQCTPHRRISLFVISPSQLIVDPGPNGSGYTSPQPEIEVRDPIAVNRGPPSSSTLPTPVTPPTAAGHITAKFENRKVDEVKDVQDVLYVVTTSTAYKIPTEHKEPSTGVNALTDSLRYPRWCRLCRSVWGISVRARPLSDHHSEVL